MGGATPHRTLFVNQTIAGTPNQRKVGAPNKNLLVNDQHAFSVGMRKGQ